MEQIKIDLADKEPPIHVKLMWYMEDCFCVNVPVSSDYCFRSEATSQAYKTILESVEYIKEENGISVITFKGLLNVFAWQKTGKIMNEREICQAVIDYNCGR